MINDLFGLRIIENPFMTEDAEPYEVQRTWKERLFSRPWHPFRKTKTIIPQVPKKEAIRMPNGSLVMHPAMASELRSQLRTKHD